MVSQKSTLSASNIKYLLAMRELNMEPRGVRSTDLARSIGVTKPSVYTMAKSLCSLGLVEKDRYGAIRFTQDGEDAQYAVLVPLHRVPERSGYTFGGVRNACRNARK
mgnify:CR=1 FL=1